MEVNNNKQKKLTIIAVVTLIALVAGATYAYFSVGVTSNFETSTINATADTIGGVVLNGNNANLNLNVTALDMAQGENSINYYATPDGTSTDEAEKETVIGTASVSPNTDTNYYHCEYTLQVSQSYSGDKNMYNIFKGTQQVDGNTYTGSDNELVLLVNGTSYDLNSNTLPKEIPGEFYIKGTQIVDITAGLKLVNLSNKNQNMLAGSGVNISIQVKPNTFTCTAEEEPTIAYWTYEGTNVDSTNANKVSNYLDLNVYKRLNNSRYYVYPISQSSTCQSDNGGSACESVTQPYFIKETLSTNPNYEVCGNVKGTVICLNSDSWNNTDSLLTEFENAGFICKYFSFDTNSWQEEKPENDSYLECDDGDPSVVGGSAGVFQGSVNSWGGATFRLPYEGKCEIISGEPKCTN